MNLVFESEKFPKLALYFKNNSEKETFLNIFSHVEETLSEYRKIHVLKTAEISIFLCEKNKIEILIDKAVTAALLHDITKERKKEFHFDIFKKHEAPQAYYLLPAALWHAKSAVYHIQDFFSIDDKDILQAVSFHTTGNQNMTELDKVVYAADFLSSTDKTKADELINLPLDVICLEKAATSIRFLLEQKKSIVKETLDFYNYLVCI